MDINRANLTAIFRMITTAFQQGMSWKAPIDLGFLIRDYTSTTATNFYAFLDMNPGFREWVGDRIWNNVRSNKFEVANRDFEKSDVMPSNDIDDDQYGLYGPVWEEYGAAWEQLKYAIAVEVLTDNPLTFTGKALFANDHAYGDNTIDNLVTDALTATSFEAAFLAAASWKYSNDELIRPVFTHLVVGEKLRSTAHGIVKAKQISDDDGNLVDNPNFGRCEMVVLPDYVSTYDDYWTLVDGSRPVKAIARQIRKAPRPIMDLRPEEVELTGEVKMFAHGRAAAAPAFPHLVYGGRL